MKPRTAGRMKMYPVIASRRRMEPREPNRSRACGRIVAVSVRTAMSASCPFRSGDVGFGFRQDALDLIDSSGAVERLVYRRLADPDGIEGRFQHGIGFLDTGQGNH